MKVFVKILYAECQKDHVAQQPDLFSLFDTSLVYILALFCFRSLLRDSRFETSELVMLLFHLKIQ